MFEQYSIDVSFEGGKILPAPELPLMLFVSGPES